ncbi:MAG: FtsQ-type POTRA domain-containing protein [Pseudomonadota bacterium]
MQSLKAALRRSNASAGGQDDPFSAPLDDRQTSPEHSAASATGEGDGRRDVTRPSLDPGVHVAANEPPMAGIAARFASYAAGETLQVHPAAGTPTGHAAGLTLRADAPAGLGSQLSDPGFDGANEDARPRFLRRPARPSFLARTARFGRKVASMAGLSALACAGIVLLSIIAGKPLVTGTHVQAGLDNLAVAAGYELRQISVTGYRPNTSAQVFAYVDAGRPVSLIGYDRQAARERLQTLPWVADVEFTAELPDKLHIAVLPKLPVAIAINEPVTAVRANDPIGLAASGARLVAGDGTPLGSVPSDAAARDLLVVSGQRAAQAALTLQEALRDAPWLRDALAVAHRVGERRWDLHLHNGLRVSLPDIDGRPDTWALAVQALATWRRDVRLEARALTGRDDERGVLALIDLRNPSRPVLRYRQGGEALDAGQRTQVRAQGDPQNDPQAITRPGDGLVRASLPRAR